MVALWKNLETYGLPFVVEDDHKRYSVRSTPEWSFERQFDHSAWKYFFGTARLSDIMSSKEINEFHKKLEDPEPFTATAARGYIANSGDIARQMMENLIKQVFERLTSATYRPGNSWKSPVKKQNNMRIEKTFRISEPVHHNSWKSRWDWYYTFTPIFTDLQKACCILDGKIPPRHPDDLNSKIKATDEPIVTCDYFEVALYKNGNQKVKFLDMEILEKLNKYGAPGTLLGNDVRVQVFE